MSGPPFSIRLVDLDRLGDELDQLEARAGLLSADERAWPQPAGNDPIDIRRRRRRARIALRLLIVLAGPDCVRGAPFHHHAEGKPSLPGAALAFNMSHSAGKALIAIGPVEPIGIDLEGTRIVSLGAERQRLIEAAGLAMAGGDGRSTDFLSTWTCLEAFGKARGSGIGAVLSDLDITARGVAVLTTDTVHAKAVALLESCGLAVAPLALPAGLYGAVCAQRNLLTTPPTLTSLEADEIAAFA